LCEQHATPVMAEQCRNTRAGHESEERPFMGEEMRNDFEPHGLAHDRHAPQARKIPCAHLRRWSSRAKSALGQYRACPRNISGRAAWPCEGVSPRVIFEYPNPWFSAYQLRDLGE